MDLREKLIAFARELGSNQWHESGTYEPSVEDKIEAAVAGCKADIGRALLEALEASEEKL